MKKIYSVVWLVLGSLVLIQCPLNEGQACGWGPEGEMARLSFLDPAISGLKERTPFYYTEEFYYGDQIDPDDKDIERNVNEWMAYLGPEVKRKDFDNAVYETSAEDFLFAIRKGLNQENTFYKKIRSNKLLQDYWVLARKSEFVSFALSTPWREEDYGADKAEDEQINTEQETRRLKAAWNQALMASTDVFLKERNAYQAVVWNRYAEDYNGVIQVFDTHLSKSKSILRPWALLHKANALYHKEKKIAANLALIDVYQSCESRKLRCMQGFDFSLTDKTLALLKNNKDKATGLAMTAARNAGPALPAIKALWQNPEHQEADALLLLTREVNKLESWLYTRSIAGFESSLKEWNEEETYPEYVQKEWLKNPATVKNQMKDLAYLREFRAWMEGVWPGAKGNKADLMALYIGHLFAVEGKPADANAWFQKIKNTSSGIAHQLKLEQLLLLPYLKSLNEAGTQKELAQLLEAWYKDGGQQQWKYKPGSLEAFYAYHFFKVGNIPYAALFSNVLGSQPLNEYTGSEYYASIRFLDRHADLKVMDEVLALVKNPGASPLAAWLVQRSQVNQQTEQVDGEYYWENYNAQPGVNQLLELRGTLALREGNTAEALRTWQQIPEDFWEDAHEFKLWLDQDLFVDAAHWPWEGAPAALYNKTHVARQLLDLENKYAAAKGKEKAELAWQLGNAWYNLSYYGHSWMVLSYGKHLDEATGESYFNFDPNAQKIKETYYGCGKAKEYYASCLQSKPDQELAARASYLSAWIDQKFLPKEERDWDAPPKPPVFSNLFIQWGKQYKNTKVYQERMITCPELAAFLDKKR